MHTKIVSNKVTDTSDTSDTSELSATAPPVLEPVESSTAVDSSNLAITYEPRKQYELYINEIRTDPNQPRKVFDEVEVQELTVSVKRFGVLQPVLFTMKDGELVLVAGERRYQASKIAGIETIPGIYIDGSDNAEIALVENLQRVDLTPIEEAEALERLKVEKNYTNVELADVIGKAQSTISEILTLNKLPDEHRNNHRGDRNVSRRKLLELAKAVNKKGFQKLYDKLLNNASRDELRASRTPRTKAEPEVLLKKAIDGLTAMLQSVNTAEIDVAQIPVLVGSLELLTLEVNRITEVLWQVMPKSSARRM